MQTLISYNKAFNVENMCLIVTSNYSDAFVLVPLDKEVSSVTERLRVEKQRRDVLKQNPYRKKELGYT
jgi:hypothetical protein